MEILLHITQVICKEIWFALHIYCITCDKVVRTTKRIRDWSTWCGMKDWGSWVCLTWRKEGEGRSNCYPQLPKGEDMKSQTLPRSAQ